MGDDLPKGTELQVTELGSAEGRGLTPGSACGGGGGSGTLGGACQYRAAGDSGRGPQGRKAILLIQSCVSKTSVLETVTLSLFSKLHLGRTEFISAAPDVTWDGCSQEREPFGESSMHMSSIGAETLTEAVGQSSSGDLSLWSGLPHNMAAGFQ